MGSGSGNGCNGNKGNGTICTRVDSEVDSWVDSEMDSGVGGRLMGKLMGGLGCGIIGPGLELFWKLTISMCV